MGDYGQFVFLSALNAVPDGDDGSATLAALTKCDAESWCNQIEAQNCTMTRETPILVGTYSHAWGTAPIAAAAGGLLGITQTAPAWAAFTVAPRLGALRFASLRVPTLRGAVEVRANATHTAVAVPCGAAATLCARRIDAGSLLLLDGEPVAGAATTALHLCVGNVGCGAGGAARVVTGTTAVACDWRPPCGENAGPGTVPCSCMKRAACTTPQSARIMLIHYLYQQLSSSH
jgi:hypothetical protein